MKLREALAFFRGAGPFAFCLRAGALLLVLGLASLSRPFTRCVESPLILLDAYLTHLSLRFIGIDARLSGRMVSSPDFSIKVIPECTGIFTFIILVSLTLAFPAQCKAKLKGLLLGAGLIFLLNHLRLVSLFLIGRSFQDVFEDVHLFVWQPFFIVAVVLYWYAWARRAVPGTSGPAGA